MSPLAQIRGYATRFDRLSAPIGHDDEPSFRAIIRQHAFGGLCNQITATILHSDRRIGGTWDRSLRVWTDATGVAFELDIPCTSDGVALRNMVASANGGGGINSMSIGFNIRDSVVSYAEDGLPIHDVSRAEIGHISIVAAGAFPGACCWVAGMPMSPEIARASAHWNFGVIARNRKQGADRALARYLAAKAAAPAPALRGPADYRKPLLTIPPMPIAMMRAASMGISPPMPATKRAMRLGSFF
jgi:phage head maturation protease